MVMVGIVLLTRIYNVDAGGITLVGVAAGLLSGLCYALFIFGFKYAGPYGSPQAILLIAFAVLTGILMVLGDTAQIMGVPRAHSWPLFALLGLIGGGLSFIMYIVGLRNTAPAVASIVAMVEPVTASLFGVLVFNENLAGLQIFGMILILITVTGLSVYSRIQKIWWRRRRIKPIAGLRGWKLFTL
jgi:drug/metabolite transporter (DMT)-like permease